MALLAGLMLGLPQAGASEPLPVSPTNVPAYFTTIRDGKSLLEAGDRALNAGSLRQAERDFLDAVAAFRGEQDRDGEALASMRLARLSLQRDERSSARRFYERAAFLLEDSSLKVEAYTCISELAQLYVTIGDTARADSLYRQLRKRAEQQRDPVAVAGTFLGTARVALLSNRLEEADRDLDKAWKLYEKAGQTADLAEVLVIQSGIARNQGDHKKAYDLARQASLKAPERLDIQAMLMDHALALGRISETLERAEALRGRDLPPQERLEVLAVELAARATLADGQGLSETAARLRDAYQELNVSHDTLADLSSLSHFLHSYDELTRTRREALGGILQVLRNRKTALSETVLNGQLKVLERSFGIQVENES